METSLDEMYADIKAPTSRWKEEVASLVDRYLDENKANCINTIEDCEKRYGNKNSGNSEVALTGSQKAAFMFVAMMGTEGNPDDESNYLWERMGRLFTNMKCVYEADYWNYEHMVSETQKASLCTN